MSGPKKHAPELECIEDALIESVMRLSGQELRDEIAASGADPETCITDVDATIASAKAECTQKRLQDARAELAVWRERNEKADDSVLATARARLERLRSSDHALDSKMMLAARKGEGLSERDLEGLLEDMAELERLEGGKEDE